MSSISKAGIFIDCKALLVFTEKVKKQMSNAEKEDYGRPLVQYNLDMISAFTMAYHRKDEKIAFDYDGKHVILNLMGEKREYVDKLEASFDNYQTVMEFCFKNLTFSRLSKRKKRRWHKEFMMLMAKIGTGIVKWSGSIYKQVSISETT